MKIKFVLFDLDGTLLPMDQDVFTKTYFGLLAQKLEPFGYEPKALINAVWAGTSAMIKNTGDKTNEQVFWDKFAEIFGEQSRKDEIHFEKFYIEDFCKVKVSSGFNTNAQKVVDKVKEKGLKLALATNPIFPRIATEQRISWAGLNINDFELITTYENSNYCKPNLYYYKQILTKLGVNPEECLMIGNDVTEDMVAEKLGMKVFLLTNCLLNKNEEDISKYPNGDFDKLLHFIDGLT